VQDNKGFALITFHTSNYLSRFLFCGTLVATLSLTAFSATAAEPCRAQQGGYCAGGVRGHACNPPEKGKLCADVMTRAGPTCECTAASKKLTATRTTPLPPTAFQPAFRREAPQDWVLVLGGNIGGAQSWNNYGDFPTFDGNGWGAGGFAVLRYYFQPNLFVGPDFGGMFLNVNGTNPDGAFAKYRWMTYEGGQVGYTFAVPNATRANLYLGAAFSQGGINVGVNAGDFSESMSKTLNGWTAHGGIEFQPAPVSIPNLWFGVDYRYSRWSGNVDGDPVSAGIHMISGTASFQIPVGR
jgi:Outer membrane protein beta-barrel domain